MIFGHLQTLAIMSNPIRRLLVFPWLFWLSFFFTILTTILCSQYLFAQTVADQSVSNQEISSAQLRLYHQLLKELRCPRCEGQSLAESNAAIAKGIRNQVYALVVSGKSKEDIKTYLVTRYGETILFQPRFNWKNLVLWLAPAMLGVILFFWFFKRFLGCDTSPKK